MSKASFTRKAKTPAVSIDIKDSEGLLQNRKIGKQQPVMVSAKNPN